MGILEGSPVPETYAGPKAWWEVHPGATILEGNLRGQEMLAAAGLDWTVSKRRLFPENLDGVVLAEAVPNWMGVHRDTDDAFLGMVTPSYHEFQNLEMALMTDAVLDAAGTDEALYHTGGGLYGGKLAWLLAQLSADYHIKGDGSPHHDYLMAITGHTGRHALTFLTTQVRVWCGNTAAAALGSASARINLRHTSGMGNRTVEVQRALDLHVKYRDTYIGAMNQLSTLKFSPAEFRALAEVLIPVDLNGDAELVAKRRERTETERTKLTALFAASPTLDGVKGTKYRAFQAVIEYLDHAVEYRDTKKASGLDRSATALIEGPGYVLKTKAAELLGVK